MLFDLFVFKERIVSMLQRLFSWHPKTKVASCFAFQMTSQGSVVSGGFVVMSQDFLHLSIWNLLCNGTKVHSNILLDCACLISVLMVLMVLL